MGRKPELPAVSSSCSIAARAPTVALNGTTQVPDGVASAWNVWDGRPFLPVGAQTRLGPAGRAR